jgi:hypothetical protein
LGVSFSDLRAAIFIAYAILMVWRVSAGMGEGWWLYVAGFTILIRITYRIEHVLEESRVRKHVAYLSALDPADAEARLNRIWSVSARRALSEMLHEEGAVESDGAAERFPFPRSVRRAVSTLFWFLAGAAVAAFGVLAFSSRVSSVVEWGAWLSGAVLALGAGWARRESRMLASVLEVSRFGVTEIADDGTRRALRWTQPLLLRNRPKRRRLELHGTQRPDSIIPLDYRRLGFERLLRSVVEYGGFRPTAEEEPTPPEGGVSES